MKVNIYTYTTANAPKKKLTAYGFVIECETSKGPATLTHFGTFKDVNRNQAELLTIEEALKKLNKPCELKIYTTPYIWTAFNMWLPRWKENGWKNQKGQDVDEEFKRLENLLKPHSYLLETEKHEYSVWLKRETVKEEIRCSTNTENLTQPKRSPKR